MDKDWKLHRYTKKDYTEIVEFPVEIVGRDGVVRRYGFEDSIRLYQRRVTFASMRYADAQLVQAEVHHCRSRIEQLRRSYFQRYGWGFGEGDVDPTQAFGDLAGEIAAFLCRVLQSPGRPDITVEPVQSADFGGVNNPVSIWYVVPYGFTSGMLLYLYRFHDDEPLRDRFLAELRAFEGLDAHSSDGERLIAHHHTIDCGMYLSARGAEFEAFAAWQSPEEDEGAALPTRWDHVLKLMRSGHHQEALQQCHTVVAEQPWHRRAYITGAALALRERIPVEAEELALLGAHFFPDDPVLRYQCGLARYEMGRHAEAAVALDKALDINPGHTSARLVRVLLLAEQAQWDACTAMLRDGAQVRGDSRSGKLELERLGKILTMWRFTRVSILVAGGIGLAVAFAIAQPLATTGALAGSAFFTGGAWALSNRLYRQVLRQMLRRQRLGDPEDGTRRAGGRPAHRAG